MAYPSGAYMVDTMLANVCKQNVTRFHFEIARMIEAMTGGTALVESMHGAGSPQAQWVMIFRESELNKKIRLTKALLGLPVKGARK